MAEIVRMPKMSDTMNEGVIAKWHKSIGDSVKSGELMAEIETDKATMDYESYNSGTVLYLGAKEGETIKIDDILAIVGKPGEDYSALLNQLPAPIENKEKKETHEQVTSAPLTIDNSAIKAKLVLMPKMSDTMTEGTIAVWHKKVGESVKAGDLLAEVETDKATMDYESYDSGTLLYIGAEAGKSVQVNSVLAIIGDKDADWKTLLNGSDNKGTLSALSAVPDKNQEKVSTEHSPSPAVQLSSAECAQELPGSHPATPSEFASVRR